MASPGQTDMHSNPDGPRSPLPASAGSGWAGVHRSGWAESFSGSRVGRVELQDPAGPSRSPVPGGPAFSYPGWADSCDPGGPLSGTDRSIDRSPIESIPRPDRSIASSPTESISRPGRSIASGSFDRVTSRSDPSDREPAPKTPSGTGASMGGSLVCSTKSASQRPDRASRSRISRSLPAFWAVMCDSGGCTPGSIQHLRLLQVKHTTPAYINICCYFPEDKN